MLRNTGRSQLVTVGLVLLAGLATVAADPAVAADAHGCNDAAGLKRCEGFSLVLGEARDVAKSELPAGRLAVWDDASKRASVTAKLNIESRAQSCICFVPMGPTAAEVFRNCRLDVDANGLRPVLEANGQQLGVGQGRATHWRVETVPM